MPDRHIVTATVPDATAFSEGFETLPCTVADTCDRYDATGERTVEFEFHTVDAGHAEHQFLEACRVLDTPASDIHVRGV